MFYQFSWDNLPQGLMKSNQITEAQFGATYCIKNDSDRLYTMIMNTRSYDQKIICVDCKTFNQKVVYNQIGLDNIPHGLMKCES